MKILIVSPCDLPVPAVHGGAVATLIESIIKINETEKQLDITVVSSYDIEAVGKAEQYSHTNFLWMKPPFIIKKCDGIIDCCGKKTGIFTSNKELMRKIYVVQHVKKILKINKYDAVIFQNSGYLLRVLKSKFIAKRYQGKLFYHLHNDVPANVYRDGFRKCKLLLISEYLRKKVSEICDNRNIPEMYILKNGFDCYRFTQELSQNEIIILRKNLGITKEKKVVIYAGRINPNKGIMQLVEAIEKLNRDDVVLLVVGSHNFGSTETSKFEHGMRSRFDKLGDKVKFTGYVPYLDMWKYYKFSDLAALPSMWEEPAGLTMLEASASGIPVITTISGGIPEYLDNDKVVMLERNDEIIKSIRKAIVSILDNLEFYKDNAKLNSQYICTNFNESCFYNRFVSAVQKNNYRENNDETYKI